MMDDDDDGGDGDDNGLFTRRMAPAHGEMSSGGCMLWAAAGNIVEWGSSSGRQLRIWSSGRAQRGPSVLPKLRKGFLFSLDCRKPAPLPHSLSSGSNALLRVAKQGRRISLPRLGLFPLGV